jgi:hypothetical protein
MNIKLWLNNIIFVSILITYTANYPPKKSDPESPRNTLFFFLKLK